MIKKAFFDFDNNLNPVHIHFRRYDSLRKENLP